MNIFFEIFKFLIKAKKKGLPHFLQRRRGFLPEKAALGRGQKKPRAGQAGELEPLFVKFPSRITVKLAQRQLYSGVVVMGSNVLL